MAIHLHFTTQSFVSYLDGFSPDQCITKKEYSNTASRQNRKYEATRNKQSCNATGKYPNKRIACSGFLRDSDHHYLKFMLLEMLFV